MATSPLPRNPSAQVGQDLGHDTDTAPREGPAVVLQRDELDRCGWGHRLPARHVRVPDETDPEREA